MQAYMQMDGMRFRTLIFTSILILFTFSCFLPTNFFESCRAGTPTTLYVGTNELYTTISAAIENASDGYRIVVYNGTYYENITIDKRLDLFGEERNITIINGNGRDTVITINASNVNISHFTIKNSGSSSTDAMIRANYGNTIITDNIISNGYHGIILNNSDGHFIYDNIITNNSGDGIRLNQSDSNDNISYNIITKNGNGIYFYNSDSNKIYNNIIKFNSQNGIFINKTCDTNYVVNNNITDNNNHGIYLNDFSNYSVIKNNGIYSSNNSGIVFENCSWTTVNAANKISGHTNYGMMIVGSNNVIQSNIFTHNNKDGLFLNADDNNTISSCTIAYNILIGIRLYNSTADYIYTNEIFNNSQYGVYCDFFSFNNRIYNNYFHDNTKNAIDKSQNRNVWNLGKTLGTNIVGGGYISGNYWDDFDEISEGASDPNGDGISNTAYTIYNDNKDNGPLVDVTPPSIGTPQISPSTQTVGSYTNITVTITDNIEIKNVYLVMTDPNGNSSNLSITQNKIGNTYYYRRQFSPVGMHEFYIAAKDPMNWATSLNQTFYINEGTAPTIVDNSPSFASPSSLYTFNATVTDDADSAWQLSVYVIWYHGDESGNYSMTNVVGHYFEKTITLQRSLQDLSYHYYAKDHWGNAVTKSTTNVSVTDTQAPSIQIEQYGSSFDELPGSFTFAATVRDNYVLRSVYISYWYNGSSTWTVDMDDMGNDYYKKVILPQGPPDRIYCIIYANDTNENLNDTQSPTAIHTGPYTGTILGDITFNASPSFDLDGTIANYSWTFGDGTSGYGAKPTNVYYSNGNYSVTLTITDDDNNTATNSTYVVISNHSRVTTSNETRTLVNSDFNISLVDNFFSYDTNGDDIVDTFIDPNSLLSAIHSGYFDLDDNICFLISIDDEIIPEFIWNSTMDTIYPITHVNGVVDNIVIDEEDEQAIVYLIVEKANWIFIEADDIYPDSPLTITSASSTIASERIWRENSKIYIFDDPETEYTLVFDNIFPDLESPLFSPSDGGVVDENNPTITITYNIPVTITYATFDVFDIHNQLTASDNLVFSYSPAGYLEDGTYYLNIDAQPLQGSGYDSSSATYFYFAWAQPPEQSFLEKHWMFLLFGTAIGGFIAILLFFKIKQVSIDDFVYIKNRKIIPFFKTIIFGPVSIDIPEENVTKAEFYVDGQLKNIVTEKPFYWKWEEKAFMKHTLETKIYDQQGNSSSTGEMSFYIFNLTRSK